MTWLILLARCRQAVAGVGAWRIVLAVVTLRQALASAVGTDVACSAAFRIGGRVVEAAATV
jgi:hypothetical protein